MRSRLWDLRRTALHGVYWNASYQAASALLQFGAMLVVVRLVSPQEYGHWAVALGVLQFLNAINVASLMAHALQLPSDEEPDWTLHWHVGNLLQAALFLICTAVAVTLYAQGSYRAVAALLHIASIGILLNAPAQLRIVMLQRRLDFRRMRLAAGISSLLSVVTILFGASMGHGAPAMILGGNVLVSVPFVVDLLLVERWRPVGPWLSFPDLRRYRASLVFGSGRIGASILSSSRGAMSAVFLPNTLGFAAIGLMNRAEGLFAMSVGRIVALASETVYPILPQIAADEERFARVARGYMLLVSALGLGAFGLFAACGSDVSRVLYGDKWAAADPLLLPGSLVGLAAILSTVGGQVLLAKGRLRDVFVLDLIPRVLFLPAFVGVMAFEWEMVAFEWGLAIPLLLAGVGGVLQAASRLQSKKQGSILVAPSAAAGGASLATILVVSAMGEASPAIRCAVGSIVFSAAWIGIFRIAFPRGLQEILDLIPGGATMEQLLRIGNLRSAR